MNVYLGVGAGRHDLSTWGALETAVEGGLLSENHWVELKKDIPNVKGSNAELARDIASLAVDGGTLIVGVEEKDSHAEKVVGVQLKGVQERIEQVAESLIKPRLYVHIRPLQHPSDKDLACIVVEVPASGQAPHQVDFEYYGRGETRKERLSDPAVRAVLAARAGALQRTGAELNLLASRFPTPPPTQLGHLFVIADPIDADPDALTEMLDGDPQPLYQIADRAADTLNADLRKAGTVLRHGAHGLRARPAGLALTSVTGSDIEEGRVLEYLVRRDGGIEATCGNGTWNSNAQWASTPTPVKTVACTWLLAFVHSSLALATTLTERTHYQGRWQLGVLFEGMEGAAAWEALQTAWGEDGADRYGADRYQELTLTTTAEMLDDIPGLVDRLVGNFLRGLGVQAQFLPYSGRFTKEWSIPKPAQQ